MANIHSATVGTLPGNRGTVLKTTLLTTHEFTENRVFRAKLSNLGALHD